MTKANTPMPVARRQVQPLVRQPPLFMCGVVMTLGITSDILLLAPLTVDLSLHPASEWYSDQGTRLGGL